MIIQEPEYKPRGRSTVFAIVLLALGYVFGVLSAPWFTEYKVARYEYQRPQY